MSVMLRAWLVAAVVLVGGLAARGEVRVETVNYEVGGVALRGYLAFDDAALAKRPGVLVCHEWWGNNEFARARARKLAEQGLVAFAVDMYGADKVTDDPAVAGQWAQALYADPAVLRARAAAGLKILREHKATDPSRLAAIGFCMGGTVALELARTGAELDAVVCFHTSGLTAKEPKDNEQIRARVLVCHGAADPFLKPGEIDNFVKQMEAAEVDYQVKFYGGAVHSFTNKDVDKHAIPGAKFQARAEERSWRDMMALFDEVFGLGR